MTTMTPSAVLSQRNLAFLDEHLQQRYIDAGRLVGTLTFIYRKGELAYTGALGLMDRERNRPMRRDTIFRLYSMTKPIASVALMQLYERGLVQLDDPVHRYIPEWRDLRVYQTGNHPSFITAPCERPISVRDLLSHQSGLTYGFTQRTNVDAAYRVLGIGREGCATLREMIDKLAELPLEFSPGTAWNYSVSTDVVGYLVEVISGRRLDEYLREHIFELLGMRDTGFWVRPDQVDRFAANYARAATGEGLDVVDDPQNSVYLREPTFFSGGGGLVGTADDYMRFCRALLAGGELDGSRIIGRKTLALMASNHITGGRTMAEAAVTPIVDIGYYGRGFGLGFSVMLNPAAAQLSGTPGEHAWGGAASTAFWIDPGEELAVVFMTQYMAVAARYRYPIRRELSAIIYGALT